MSRAIERYRGRDNSLEPTVVESVTENVVYSRPVVGFVNYVKLIVGLGVLGAGAYGVYLIHDTFVKMVGQVANLLFICIEAIIIVGAISLVIIIVRFTLDFALRFKVVDPGDTGKHAYIFGRWIALHPLEKQAVKHGQPGATATIPGSTTVEESVPTLTQLLQEQIIKPGISHMLFCYERDRKKKTVSPLWGEWDDLKSFGVIGKPRKGKTNTLFFLIIQILLSRANLYICDKHSTKKSGLLKMLKPLRRWYKYANDAPTIIKTFQTFAEELERRITPLPDDAPEPEYDVWVLICDEWNGLIEQIRGYDEKHSTEYTEYIIKTATSLLREAAGYGMYLGLCIHAVTEYEIGSVPLRNNIHGVIAHGMEQGYSKYFFHDRKDNARTPKLSLGEILFKNAETSDVYQGEVPLATYEDAITVASILEELDTPELDFYDNQQYLPGTAEKRIQSRALPEQIAEYSSSRDTSTTNVLPIGTRAETKQETRREAVGTGFTVTDDTSLSQAQIDMLRKIGKLAKEGKDLTTIRKELTPSISSGRGLQEVNAGIEWIKQHGLPEAVTEALPEEVVNE